MSKFPQDKNPQTGWSKKSEKGGSLRNLLAVFLVGLLFLFALGGFFKNISFNKFLVSGEKTPKGPAVLIAANTNPASLIIFQKDIGKIIVISQTPGMYFFEGGGDNPFKTISQISKNENGNELARVMTLAYRANVYNYVTFPKSANLEEENIKKQFSEFASFATPFRIIFDKDGLANTNLTRMDMLGLWWQAKNLSINDVELTDFSQYSEEILKEDNSKILGVDEDQFNRQIRQYTEIPDVLVEHKNVNIEDTTGDVAVQKLAAGFVESIGADVSDVTSDTSNNPKTEIIVNGDISKTASYLASVFNCDINRVKVDQGPQDGTITVVLGQDFEKRYLR